ncbi:MAG: hypothetical protein ACMUIG_10190, partial [Thermoplasmatota archaeon]
KATFVKSYLQSNGFTEIEDYPAPDPAVSSGIRPNMVARVPGKKMEKTLHLTGISDDQWNWLKDHIGKPEESGNTNYNNAFLFLHAPIVYRNKYNDEEWDTSNTILKHRDDLIDWVNGDFQEGTTEYDDPKIRSLFSGHSHQDKIYHKVSTNPEDISSGYEIDHIYDYYYGGDLSWSWKYEAKIYYDNSITNIERGEYLSTAHIISLGMKDPTTIWDGKYVFRYI